MDIDRKVERYRMFDSPQMVLATDYDQLLAERDGLVEQVGVQSEIIAQLRGFAEDHKHCDAIKAWAIRAFLASREAK